MKCYTNLIVSLYSITYEYLLISCINSFYFWGNTIILIFLFYVFLLLPFFILEYFLWISLINHSWLILIELNKYILVSMFKSKMNILIFIYFSSMTYIQKPFIFNWPAQSPPSSTTPAFNHWSILYKTFSIHWYKNYKLILLLQDLETVKVGDCVINCIFIWTIYEI